MDEQLFDKLAEKELDDLERKLGDHDPDDIEVDYAMGVMKILLRGQDHIVVNSHRAARQIWMAAFQRAWHFDPIEKDGEWRWRTASDDLRQTLGRLISERLGLTVDLG